MVAGEVEQEEEEEDGGGVRVPHCVTSGWGSSARTRRGRRGFAWSLKGARVLDRPTDCLTRSETQPRADVREGTGGRGVCGGG